MKVLAACGRDGNNNMFPIAFGVVGKENYKNWLWFLEMLQSVVGDGEEYGGWTIMSDRQNGLRKAVGEVFPNSEIRFCKRHIHQNFCVAGFRGGNLKEHFDATAYAYTESEFTAAMELLNKANVKAYEWLMKIPCKHWSKHAFSTHSKTYLVVNNISEGFNKYIIDYRDKPIVTMLEFIRIKLMNRLHNKEGAACATWCITPSIQGKLELEKSQARFCRPTHASLDIWQVGCGEKVYEVNLANQTCGCFKWNLTRVTCKHAISVIYKAKLVPEDYVHKFYGRDMYNVAYENIIYPMPDKKEWIKTNTEDIEPPKFTRQPGRPKKSRRKSFREEPAPTSKCTGTVICGNCHMQGHNYQTCGKKLKPDLKLRKENLQIKRKRSADARSIKNKKQSTQSQSDVTLHADIGTQSSQAGPSTVCAERFAPQVARGSRGRGGGRTRGRGRGGRRGVA